MEADVRGLEIKELQRYFHKQLHMITDWKNKQHKELFN